MRNYQILAAIAISVVSPTALNARQAEVTSFNATSASFQMIEPGFRHAAKAQPPEEESALLQLGREFAFLADEQPFRRPLSALDGLVVPEWMRSNRKALTPNLNLPAYTWISSENCGPVQYAPHPTLNASQELRRQRYFPQVAAAACGAGVPIALFDALIIQESRYDPLALSPKGASGLTQLMPGTARSMGVYDRWSVSQNLSGGARYLRKQLDTFGNWALALGAYNAGPGNVTKYRGLPPFRETRGYVRTILSSMNSYQASQGAGGSMPLGHRRSVTLASFTR
jgi:soluble lytic murein transglycosylase-like protein